MDPFSAATGIAGLISLGIQVTGGLLNFYISYKGQDIDVSRTTEKLEILLDTFRFLQDALQNRTFRPDERDLINNIESSIEKCREIIQELQEECEKFVKTPTASIRGIIRTAGYRAAYPFRESTLKRLDEDIGEIRHNLSLAFDVLQLRDHKRTQDDITEVKSLVEVVRASQISVMIRDWLKAPDATIQHNAACAKRHPGTGTWFVKGFPFTTWLTQGNSFLWLCGFAGCGKSVLCSTAIQHTFRHKRSDPGVGIAFFYFTFNDESKQDESALLRALLLQLSGQLSGSQTDLARLRDLYSTGIPPATDLIAYLQRLIQKFDQVYVLLDALDESPRYDQRDQVLNAIKTMRGWLLPGLHLLVTSRDEPDIRQSLNLSSDEEVTMKNAEINKDISDFISGRLKTDQELRKLDMYHGQIQHTLTEGAQGVFRWVECQFESLKRCPKIPNLIKKCLQSLPRSLDETYERILSNIDEDSVEYARRILTLLCFSSRPLTVPELQDAVAIDLKEPGGLDAENRPQDEDAIRSICPGLIVADATGNDGTHTLRIAHFSVQEYLESDRIKRHKVCAYALERASAHAEIAQICLMYLFEPGLSRGTLDYAKLQEFPLAHFAAKFWYHHYKNAAGTTSRLDSLILRMFQLRQDSFFTWARLYEVDRPLRKDKDFSLIPGGTASPVYYASFLGLNGVLHELINPWQENASKGINLINAQGGRYGNALQAASVGGHEKVVQMLIDAKADVNAQGGIYNNALCAASAGGHEKIVQMLIDAKADVNTQGGYYGNALQVASVGGHERVVQMLIDAKADVNTQGGLYDNALQAVSAGGYEKIVQILIDAKADVNAQGGYYGNALHAASAGGHERIVQMLIDAKADVNAQGGYYGNALYAASAGGYERILQMLIDAKADVNTQGGYCGNALQAASVEGHERVVQMLIDAKADVNTQGGYYGNALHAASAGGHERIVQMLIDAKADVNTQGGYYGNAIQAASARGHEKVVQRLTEAGAEYR